MKEPVPMGATVLRSNAFARCRTELLSINQDVSGIRLGRTVFGAGPVHSDDHAYVQRIAVPALASQSIRAAHLASPVRDLASLGILYVNVEIRMRIHPFDFGNNARQ